MCRRDRDEMRMTNETHAPRYRSRQRRRHVVNTPRRQNVRMFVFLMHAMRASSSRRRFIIINIVATVVIPRYAAACACVAVTKRLSGYMLPLQTRLEDCRHSWNTRKAMPCVRAYSHQFEMFAPALSPCCQPAMFHTGKAPPAASYSSALRSAKRSSASR